MGQEISTGKTSRINELFASKGYRGKFEVSFTTNHLFGSFKKDFKNESIRVIIDLERETYEVFTSALRFELDDAKEFTGIWVETIALAEESKRIIEFEGGETLRW